MSAGHTIRVAMLRQGEDGVLEYGRRGQWLNSEVLEVVQRTFSEEDLTTIWWDVSDDFFEVPFKSGVGTFKGKVGFNVGQRWFTETVELIMLDDGRVVINEDEWEKKLY